VVAVAGSTLRPRRLWLTLTRPVEEDREVGRTLTVLVKPASRRDPLVDENADGVWVVHVREPPVDRRATRAAGEALAAHLGLPRSAVTLVSGATSRYKRFHVE